jgi:hypothetical protein
MLPVDHGKHPVERDGALGQQIEQLGGRLITRRRRKPEEDNACWDGEPLAEDEFTLVPVKGQDDSLFHMRPLQHRLIRDAGYLLPNGDHIVASSAERLNRGTGNIFIGQKAHQAAARG